MFSPLLGFQLTDVERNVLQVACICSVLQLFVSLVVADGRDLAVRPHDARVVGRFGYRHLTAVERSASVVVPRLMPLWKR